MAIPNLQWGEACGTCIHYIPKSIKSSTGFCGLHENYKVDERLVCDDWAPLM
jgi:hypothetical protein